MRGTAAARTATVSTRLRRFVWAHPECWIVALCWTAWAVMLLDGWRPSSHGPTGFVPELARWMLMVTAMMVPLVVPAVRRAALASLWSRRHRAMALFLLGFVSAWLALGLVVAGLREGAWAHTNAAAALAFVGAAMWQRTRLHRRALSECHRTEPLAPRGWPADRDCLRFGAIMGGFCLGSCWPLMLACALAGHSLVAVTGGMLVGISERWHHRPRTGTMLTLTIALALYHAGLASVGPHGALASSPRAVVGAPEIVASTTASFRLGIGETRVELALRPPADPALGRSGPHRRVFLNVERMTSTGSSGPWDVYLNLPPNEAPARHPELAAGELPMFGLLESSRSDATHAAQGLYDQLEITELYDRLPGLPGWDPNRLVVTFVPRYASTVTIQVARVTVSMTRR